jgi:DNA invertase Pin-like site-specific DNA recombinase
VEFDDMRYELVAIATATATLPCTCPLEGPPCLAHRAAAAVDNMTTRGLRMHRWRNTGPAPRAVVHVAGDVVDERTPRPGHPRYISQRWQSCEKCAQELVRGRWALFYVPGALVAVRPSRSGAGRASLTFPATGSSDEQPCWIPLERGRADRSHSDDIKHVTLKSPETGPRGGRITAMKFVAYTRVSTEQQADEGLGLEVQEADCRAWAKEHRHKIVAVATDAGRSGADTLVERPGLAEALGLVRAGKAQGIVVQRLDRLARDVVLQEQLFAELVHQHAQLHSTSPTEDAHLEDDPNDPTRALVRQVLGSIAMYERQMIRVRLAAGIIAKRSAGGFTGGRPPYGWRAYGRELEKDPAEQVILRKMLTLARAGKGGWLIANEFNAKGIPARSGGLWYAGGVNVIVARNLPKPDGPPAKGGAPQITVEVP